jgi:hypothetical protein
MVPTQLGLQDSTTQYPKADFPEQSQSEPRLAKKMRPKPDRGEESYFARAGAT